MGLIRMLSHLARSRFLREGFSFRKSPRFSSTLYQRVRLTSGPSTSHSSKSITLTVLSILGGLFLFSHSAYAITPYMSMSRGTSGDIILKDGTNTSIRPTKDGTLGVGSDIVNVDTNCSAGYNIYLTTAENEGVDMILSSADTTSDIPISQKIVSSSTPIGSETTLCDACVLCLKWNRITIYAKRIV